MLLYGGGMAGARVRRLLEIEGRAGILGGLTRRWFEVELIDVIEPNELLDPNVDTIVLVPIVDAMAFTMISSASKRSCSSILRLASSVSDTLIAILLLLCSENNFFGKNGDLDIINYV